MTPLRTSRDIKVALQGDGRAMDMIAAQWLVDADDTVFSIEAAGAMAKLGATEVHMSHVRADICWCIDVQVYREYTVVACVY